MCSCDRLLRVNCSRAGNSSPLRFGSLINRIYGLNKGRISSGDRLLAKNLLWTILSIVSNGFITCGKWIMLLFNRPSTYMIKYYMFSENSKAWPFGVFEHLWDALAMLLRLASIICLHWSILAILSNRAIAFLIKKWVVADISRYSYASAIAVVSGTATLWHLILLCPSDEEYNKAV